MNTNKNNSMLENSSQVNTNKDILSTLKGTAVVDKDDMRLCRRVIDTVRRFAENYGYDEMSTPQIYDKELLTYKFDDGAELAGEIYTLSDRGERDLALRYDLTVPLARYIAENAKGVKFPFKRFEVGEVFRDGAVKKGRARQFTQCDVDVIGDVDPVITAYEQVSLMISVFDALGLDEVIIRYSSCRFINAVLSELGVLDEIIPNVVRVIDKKEKINEDEFDKELAMAGMTGEQIRSLNEKFSYSTDELLSELPSDAGNEISKFSNMIDADSRLRNRCVFVPSLVRGQDYYTGIMFEAFAPDFASSLAGGGRYDSIIADLAGVGDDEDERERYSASGVSFGIVPICCLLKERLDKVITSGDNASSVEGDRWGTIVIPCSDADVPLALGLINDMRRNMRVEVDVSTRGVSKKMKAANKAGYRFVIVFGETERESDSVNVKDMTDGRVMDISKELLVQLSEDDLVAMFE